MQKALKGESWSLFGHSGRFAVCPVGPERIYGQSLGLHELKKETLKTTRCTPCMPFDRICFALWHDLDCFGPLFLASFIWSKMSFLIPGSSPRPPSVVCAAQMATQRRLERTLRRYRMAPRLFSALQNSKLGAAQLCDLGTRMRQTRSIKISSPRDSMKTNGTIHQFNITNTMTYRHHPWPSMTFPQAEHKSKKTCDALWQQSVLIMLATSCYHGSGIIWRGLHICISNTATGKYPCNR